MGTSVRGGAEGNRTPSQPETRLTLAGVRERISRLGLPPIKVYQSGPHLRLWEWQGNWYYRTKGFTAEKGTYGIHQGKAYRLSGAGRAVAVDGVGLIMGHWAAHRLPSPCIRGELDLLRAVMKGEEVLDTADLFR